MLTLLSRSAGGRAASVGARPKVFKLHYTSGLGPLPATESGRPSGDGPQHGQESSGLVQKGEQ